MTIFQRFWAKVLIGDGCWLWTAALDGKGYGRFGLRKPRLVQAHRLAYGWLVGPIPDGLELDHLCRTPRCVRPDHLEAVTHAENIRRGIGTAPQFQAAKTHCPQGHPYDMTDGQAHRARRCRACRQIVTRAAQRRYRARRKELAAA